MKTMKDFFSHGGDIVAMPSGVQAERNGNDVSKYRKVFEPLTKAVIVIAATAGLVGCGPSREEIDEMKSQVPGKDKTEIMAQYDSTLLAKIDSVYMAGQQKDMPGSIRQAQTISWEEARARMPEKKKEWTGKEWTLSDHAQDRSKQSYKVTTTQEYGYHYGYSAMKGKMCYHMGHHTVSHTNYLPEFRDQLAKDVKAHQDAKTVQTATAAKAVQGR